MSENKTHFGFETVDEKEKAGLVGGVFRSVAGNYDLMNDLMSAGVHRLWKAFTVGHANIKDGYQVLDVAGGSGDLALAFAKRVGDEGMVVLSDINEAMLEQGRNRTIDEGLHKRVVHTQLDAENIPFDDNHFDIVSIGFGLRNVTNIPKALKEMARVLKPGGRLLVLEFSRPTTELMRTVYDAYSFNVIPKIGKYVAQDEAAYQYLVESIRKHPDQETLKGMMLESGFDDVKVHNMTGGVVALHVGYVYS